MFEVKLMEFIHQTVGDLLLLLLLVLSLQIELRIIHADGVLPVKQAFLLTKNNNLLTTFPSV